MSAALHPGCDQTMARAAAPAGASAPAHPHPRLVLATTILASSLAFIDGSIVNVGLPAIEHGLGADGAALSWVVNGYLLPLSALLLTGGAAGDHHGRRRMLLLGVALFLAASVACAAAPSLAWLVAGRVLQGAAAALLMPNSLAVLGTTFSGAARGRAIGTWAAVGAGAGALGPLLGGWLIDAVGWRAMFLVNVPIAGAALLLGWRYLPDTHNANAAPLDLPGAALASAGLAALTWGLTVVSAPAQGQGLAGAVTGSAPLQAVAALLGGALLLLLFLLWQRRQGSAAMLPLALFASRSFVGLSLLTFALYGALGGVLVLVPYVLIDAAGYSATAAGAALLPLPLAIGLASPTMGRLAGRFGARVPLTAGPLVVAAGFALCLRVGSGASYWASTFPAMLVVAVGMGAVAAPLTTAVLASVSGQQTGVASGFNSAVARTGGLVATALLGFVLALHGPALQAAFHAAVVVGAAVAVAAAACAFATLAGLTQDADEAPR